MVFVPSPNTYQATLKYTMNGQFCENVSTWTHAVPNSNAIAANLNDLLSGWWQNNLANHLSSDVKMVECRTIALDEENGGFSVMLFSPGEPGIIVSPALPGNVSATCTFLTAQRGRSFRGRWYIVGIAESMATGNFLTSGIQADYQADFDALVTAMNVGEFQHVICSRFHNGAPRTTAVVTDVNGYRVNLPIYSQRRRLRQGSV